MTEDWWTCGCGYSSPRSEWAMVHPLEHLLKMIEPLIMTQYTVEVPPQ